MAKTVVLVGPEECDVNIFTHKNMITSKEQLRISKHVSTDMWICGVEMEGRRSNPWPASLSLTWFALTLQAF